MPEILPKAALKPLKGVFELVMKQSYLNIAASLGTYNRK